MRLARLLVSEVRNLADQQIDLIRGLNLLVGPNGQGKSSLLESVYLLGTTRSFRTSRLGEVVRIGGGPARVAGDGELPGERLAILISQKERRYIKNGKPAGAADYIGTLDVVALSSDIVQGFRRRPAERRRFLDRMALATYPGYLYELRDLRRACAQRAILSASGTVGPERRAWDEKAASLALPVARRRREMAEALERNLRATAPAIFLEGGALTVKHLSRPPFDPANELRYVEELAAIFSAQGRSGGGSTGPRDAGIRRGDPPPIRRETPAGPLRDDLAIAIEERDLIRYGSAGQFRSLLTAAVLAEMTRLRDAKGEFPVLLLDDVDADLDESRYSALLSSLHGEAQTLAATSKPGLVLGQATPERRFEVREGRIAVC